MIIKDKKRLKKQTKAYEAALSGGGYSGAVVYYNQGDSPWGKHRFRGPYGTNKIKPAGCGPTSMAICISTITGQQSKDIIIKVPDGIIQHPQPLQNIGT